MEGKLELRYCVDQDFLTSGVDIGGWISLCGGGGAPSSLVRCLPAYLASTHYTHSDQHYHDPQLGKPKRCLQMLLNIHCKVQVLPTLRPLV